MIGGPADGQFVERGWPPEKKIIWKVAIPQSLTGPNYLRPWVRVDEIMEEHFYSLHAHQKTPASTPRFVYVHAPLAARLWP